jgi:hypothetical protein
MITFSGIAACDYFLTFDLYTLIGLMPIFAAASFFRS